MGKYEYEIINEMSVGEFTRWQAYLNIKASDVKKAQMKYRSARGGTKRGSKSR